MIRIIASLGFILVVPALFAPFADAQVVSLTPGKAREFRLRDRLKVGVGHLGQRRERKDSVVSVSTDAPGKHLVVKKLPGDQGVALLASALAGGHTYDVVVTYKVRIEEWARIQNREGWMRVGWDEAEESLEVVVDLPALPQILVPVGEVITLEFPETTQVTRIHPRRRKKLETDWTGNIIRLKGKAPGQEKLDISYRVGSRSFRQRFVKVRIGTEISRIPVSMGTKRTILLSDLDASVEVELIRILAVHAPPTASCTFDETQLQITAIGDTRPEGQAQVLVIGRHPKYGECIVPLILMINLDR